MSTASLLVNVLHVTVIVGIVAPSKSHQCFGVNVEAAVHKMLLLECYQAWLAFSHHRLTETGLIQQLVGLCDYGINIVSSFGSLGHAKVITYLYGCQVDWSQTICFLCISARPLWLIGWAIVISSGGQRQPMADCRQISKLLLHVSRFSLYSKLDMMWMWTR